MSKCRTLSPEFWDDPDVAELNLLDRLLLIGIITRLCDDYGRFRQNPKIIKKTLFGYDTQITPQQIEDGLRKISEKFQTFRSYTVGSHEFMEVGTFDRWQQIRYKAKSDIPPPPSTTENKEVSEDSAESCGNLQKSATNSPWVELSSVGSNTPPIVPPKGGREEAFDDPWKDSLDAVAVDLSERFHVKCAVDWWQKLAYECMGEDRTFEPLLKFKANMLAWSDVYREREPGMLPSRSALRYDIKNGMWLAPPPKAQAALAEVDEFNAFVKRSLATNQRHAGELAGVPR